jgi:hypothetical protein
MRYGGERSPPFRRARMHTTTRGDHKQEGDMRRWGPIRPEKRRCRHWRTSERNKREGAGGGNPPWLKGDAHSFFRPENNTGGDTPAIIRNVPSAGEGAL